MEQFVLFAYVFYQSQRKLPKIIKLGTKARKRGGCTKRFRFYFQCCKSRLKTSHKKDFFSIKILTSPRIRLNQSDNIKLDNRDIKKSIVDFVCELKREKKTSIQTFTLPDWKMNNFHLIFVINENVKRKTEDLGSFSKSEKVSLNRLCSWD